MATVKIITRADRKRLAMIVRETFRGGRIDDAALAWVKKVDTHELFSMRNNVSNAAFHRVIKRSTTSLLFPGDSSVPTRAHFLQSVGEWFALTLLDEIGPDDAADQLEELQSLVHFEI